MVAAWTLCVRRLGLFTKWVVAPVVLGAALFFALEVFHHLAASASLTPGLTADSAPSAALSATEPAALSSPAAASSATGATTPTIGSVVSATAQAVATPQVAPQGVGDLATAQATSTPSTLVDTAALAQSPTSALAATASSVAEVASTPVVAQLSATGAALTGAVTSVVAAPLTSVGSISVPAVQKLSTIVARATAALSRVGRSTWLPTRRALQHGLAPRAPRSPARVGPPAGASSLASPPTDRAGGSAGGSATSRWTTNAKAPSLRLRQEPPVSLAQLGKKAHGASFVSAVTTRARDAHPLGRVLLSAGGVCLLPGRGTLGPTPLRTGGAEPFADRVRTELLIPPRWQLLALSDGPIPPSVVLSLFTTPG